MELINEQDVGAEAIHIFSLTNSQVSYLESLVPKVFQKSLLKDEFFRITNRLHEAQGFDDTRAGEETACFHILL